MAVDEQKEVIAIVRWQEYASRTDIDPAERIGGGRAKRQEIDRFVDGVNAVGGDVLGGERGRHAGCRRAPLGRLMRWSPPFAQDNDCRGIGCVVGTRPRRRREQRQKGGGGRAP